jgi:AraC-like DNA-binding protein
MYFYKARMRLGDREFMINPGDITITPAGIPAWYDLPEPGYHYCAHFSFADDPPDSPELDIPCMTPAGHDQDIKSAVFLQAQHFHLLSGGSPFAGQAAAGAVTQLLFHLAVFRGGDESAPGTKLVFRRLEKLVEENLERPLPVSWISEKLGISGNYLARKFRERYGMTINEFIRARRSAKARMLLAHTTLPVKTVGAMSGYPDPRHFNKIFRRTAGESPLSFRLRAHGKDDILTRS